MHTSECIGIICSKSMFVNNTTRIKYSINTVKWFSKSYEHSLVQKSLEKTETNFPPQTFRQSICCISCVYGWSKGVCLKKVIENDEFVVCLSRFVFCTCESDGSFVVCSVRNAAGGCVYALPVHVAV